MYPIVRLRRNRRTIWLREMAAETNLISSDLILPVFVIEGQNKKEEIPSMPGVHRLSIDKVVDIAKEASHLGIQMIALFPALEQELKSESGEEAYNQDNLICRTIRAIKNAQVKIGICVDVALDPYTISGHDGILIDGDVDNDKSVEALSNQALVLAKAGADVIAPSDMMDGRISAIRELLDDNNFGNVNIIAYAAKYNSNFYAPFRQACNSKRSDYLCKATYQLDYRNLKEALREIEQDIDEGADMVMVKPGMPYLDVVREAVNNFNIHVFAYQVSGEYAMLKFASLAGAISWQDSLIESLSCFKRAGASGIFSYGAIEAAKILNKK